MSDAGHVWPAYRRAVRAAWSDAGGDDEARAAVVASVTDLGCPGAWPSTGRRVAVATPPAALLGPDLPGLVLEALLDPSDRRRAGRHHTPAAIADGIVALAGDAAGCTAVCDPAVGGGAFLLAFVRAASAAGVDAAEAVARCWGCDLDPLAVEVTRAALRWAGGRVVGEGPVEEQVVVADGLDPGRWRASFDLVIGNPPFQGQLGRVTARSAVDRDRAARALDRPASGYVDTAGLFLVTACELARPGGTVALLQPEGLLSARDAAPVRERVQAAGRLRAAWVAGERVFEAAIRVWAPVVDVGASPNGTVEVRAGAGFDRVGEAVLDEASWAALLAPVHRTPAALVRSDRRLGDVATATAGFRDQFYGLVPFVGDGPGGAPLVTSGAIDPLSCSWGERPIRFARRDWTRPVVALDRLAVGDPALHRWVADRLVPKVLVATQTKVVEAVADPEGTLVPSVPVVAVTPDPAEVWAVTAALSAPPVAAWALRQAAGAALAADAVKLSAKQILEAPLPVDDRLWAEIASRLATGDLPAPEFATLMTRAYGLAADDPVVAWWLSRLRSWCGRSHG